MLKKATVLLIVFTLIVSFSMTAFASSAEITEENGSKIIETPTEPTPNGNAVSEDSEDYEGSNENKKGHGPHNPIYVGGE